MRNHFTLVQSPVLPERLIQYPLNLTVHAAKFVGRPFFYRIHGIRIQP